MKLSPTEETSDLIITLNFWFLYSVRFGFTVRKRLLRRTWRKGGAAVFLQLSQIRDELFLLQSKRDLVVLVHTQKDHREETNIQLERL